MRYKLAKRLVVAWWLHGGCMEVVWIAVRTIVNTQNMVEVNGRKKDLTWEGCHEYDHEVAL